MSITVPAYNAEKYLDKCLAPFEMLKKDKREAFESIEVIIVNDGSSDNTSGIAHKYAQQEPEVYKIVDKANGGHGSGINTGVRMATGKYFKVVDADDWLNSDELEGYIYLLKKMDSDVIASDFVCVDDSTLEPFRYIKACANEDWYGKEIDINEDVLNKVIKMHSFTIKTEILQTYYTAIDEHCFYVDQEYITFPVPFFNTVYFDKRNLYMYRLGRRGQSMSADVIKRNRLMHRKVLDRLIEYYNQTSYLEMSPNKLTYFKRCIGDMVDNQFQIYISLGNQKGIEEELRDWDTQLKRDNPDIYHATSKKSIDILRITNYKILPLGCLVYKLVKKKG